MGFRAILSLTPFRQHSSSTHLPNSQQSLTDILPATLTHPVNLLILGIDNDDDSKNPQLSTDTTSEQAFLSPSDTLLLVRFLPESAQLHVLSIPRDTLVQLPGRSVAKIGQANVQGGALLAAQTVSHDLGAVLQIDRYIRISRNGLMKLVDVLGGIEVDIPKKMDYNDDSQHLYIHFKPGKQKLDGRHLQMYVRFRHDELGDIGRVQRQQEVIKTILQTMTKPENISKLPDILQIAQQNIDTDLSLDEMLALLRTALTSDRNKNKFLMLPGRFSSKNEYSLSYWIEDRQAGSKILAQYFNASEHTETSQNASGYREASHNGSPISVNQLNIAVANATKHPEVAKLAVIFLKKQGFGNVYITDHETYFRSETAGKTQIIAQRGNTEAADLVKNLITVGEIQVAATGDIYSDVTIVVDDDFASKLNAQQGN
ncbi:LCP family protein [Tumidithrix elongata RA019]|uniref:LCP family protein n=1 Tax=Tumidithrix elongata BACA0141 TaxID=2716417 RepID=A0AAW9PT31_9CYAN|nr:LCP family protein [Tumidithrix elongata RA019]